MFSTVDFSKYILKRKNFYDELGDFVIDPDHISQPILIDSSFLEKIEENFSKFLQRRLESDKFSHQENQEYKQLIKRTLPETEQVFQHNGPTIYWFKINRSNGLTNQEILNQYSAVKSRGTGWWTKVNLNRASVQSDTLYLGKVQTAFQNRFIQHIGLGHDFTTSLKLLRWMPALKDMSLTFQFLKLDNKWVLHTEDIEKVLWEASEPLLGESPRF